jgi:hypothetical protein
VPQIEDYVPLSRQVQPISRDRRTQRVAAQPFEPRPIPRRRDNGGVEIEAIHSGVTGAASRRRLSQQGRQRAASTHRRTGSFAEGPASLYRGFGNAGQHRRLVPPRIGGAPLAAPSKSRFTFIASSIRFA